MQSISWLGFAVVSPVVRTAVHFFPSGRSVGAPYPTNCALTVFGAGLARRTVVLDGARLGQPDGVWLDDAFPEVSEKASGLVGIGVEITANQPRVDLSASGCIVEIASAGASVKYRAAQIQPDQEAGPSSRPALALRDSLNVVSLVVINASEKALEPEVQVAGTGESGLRQLSVKLCEPDSVEELQVADAVWETGAPSQEEELAPLFVRTGTALSASFLVCRDTAKKLVSVCAL